CNFGLLQGCLHIQLIKAWSRFFPPECRHAPGPSVCLASQCCLFAVSAIFFSRAGVSFSLFFLSALTTLVGVGSGSSRLISGFMGCICCIPEIISATSLKGCLER